MREVEEGLILSIKVIPRAGKNEIVGWQAERLKIKVCAPPEKGEANQAVISLLAKALDVPPHKIRLLKGETKRKKEILILGFTRFQFEKSSYRSKGDLYPFHFKN
ncbi:MAG: YggU family protein [Chlamydiia bacterium]|nr:YggU family protein [Chlamydiia bacterium]